MESHLELPLQQAPAGAFQPFMVFSKHMGPSATGSTVNHLMQGAVQEHLLPAPKAKACILSE